MSTLCAPPAVVRLVHRPLGTDSLRNAPLSRAEMNRLAETWTRTPTARGCGRRALLRISCAARTNLGPICNKTVYIINEKEPCIWEGRMGRWGRLKECYLIPESISSHRPSPFFSPRPVLNPVVSVLKNTFRLVAVWCKKCVWGVRRGWALIQAPCCEFSGPKKSEREGNCWGGFKNVPKLERSKECR